jgi:integrase
VALFKRSPGGPWWVKFSSGGKVIRRSSGSTERKFAEEFETTLRARFLRQAKLGEVVHTWRDATKRYLKEGDWRPSTRATNEYALTFFTPLDPLPIGEIDADVARTARDFVERTQTPSSANRMMAVFGGVLHKCVKKWKWLTHCPPIPMARLEAREFTPPTIAELQRLLKELPNHSRFAAMFSILQGPRMGNTRDLVWEKVDLDKRRAWVPSSQYKAKRSHGMDLSIAAVKLLEALPEPHTGHVFTYRGKPIGWTFNTKAFRKARKRAGLDHFRWHDFRHVAASLLVKEGASDQVLMAVMGWKDPRMASRYTHFRGGDLRQYVDAVGTILDTVPLADVESDSAEKPRKQVVPSI